MEWWYSNSKNMNFKLNGQTYILPTLMAILFDCLWTDESIYCPPALYIYQNHNNNNNNNNNNNSDSDNGNNNFNTKCCYVFQSCLCFLCICRNLGCFIAAYPKKMYIASVDPESIHLPIKLGHVCSYNYKWYLCYPWHTTGSHSPGG